MLHKDDSYNSINPEQGPSQIEGGFEMYWQLEDWVKLTKYSTSSTGVYMTDFRTHTDSYFVIAQITNKLYERACSFSIANAGGVRKPLGSVTVLETGLEKPHKQVSFAVDLSSEATYVGFLKFDISGERKIIYSDRFGKCVIQLQTADDSDNQNDCFKCIFMDSAGELYASLEMVINEMGGLSLCNNNLNGKERLIRGIAGLNLVPAIGIVPLLSPEDFRYLMTFSSQKFTELPEFFDNFKRILEELMSSIHHYLWLREEAN